MQQYQFTNDKIVFIIRDTNPTEQEQDSLS